MKKWERWAGVFILLAGVVLMLQSYLLSLGPPGQPGPGFLGFFLGLALAGCALAYILGNKSETADSRPFWPGGAWKKPLLSGGALVAFIFSMWLIGTVVTMVLFFIFWVRGLERRSWTSACVLAVFGTASFYLIFSDLLQIPLPRGFLFT